uniref:Uncharacterized protein n=1 Tax=Solanum tuberosum TaxID=4113 RepID=M1AGC3_SOLTU
MDSSARSMWKDLANAFSDTRHRLLGRKTLKMRSLPFHMGSPVCIEQAYTGIVAQSVS